MFCAVLKSLKYRSEGYSAQSANNLAYATELIGYVGDGTADDPSCKKAKRELAKYSREVLKFHSEIEKKNKLSEILSQCKPENRHETIDFGIEGKELI